MVDPFSEKKKKNTVPHCVSQPDELSTTPSVKELLQEYKAHHYEVIKRMNLTLVMSS